MGRKPLLDRAKELVKEAIAEHANYNTAELDRSCPVKKGTTTRRRLGEQVTVNAHTMGGKIEVMLHTTETHIAEGIADMVEFQAQVSGHEATEKAGRIQAW